LEVTLRRFVQYLAGTFFLSLLIVSLTFAGGYQLNEHGARATGMGGAFVAQASDPSAIFFNPAGLAFQKGLNVMGGGTFVFPSTTFKPTSIPGYDVKQESQTYFPPNLYGTYAVDDQLVVGLGVFTPYGLGSEWNKSWIGSAIAVKTSIQTFYINPSVSYKISDQLSVGVGLSYIYGTVDLSKRVPIAAAGVNGTLSLTGTGTGLGYNIGVLCKPIENLSLGASFRSLTKLEFSGDAKFTDMGVLAGYFPGGTGKATLPMPMNILVGAAYKITPDLTVEADLQFVGWSEYKELAINLPTGPIFPAYGIPLQKTQVQDKKWDDGYLGRFGVEYNYSNDLALRAGIIYDITPQPGSKMEPMLPDANRIDLTLGAGYKITDQLSADFVYMIVLFSDRTSSFVPTGSTSVFGGEYSSTAHLFGFDVSYSF
jgi:long-chain fatty acid transport protein